MIPATPFRPGPGRPATGFRLALAALPLLLAAAAPPPARSPAWVISANENKLSLASGVTQVVPGAPADTVTFLDFRQFPPAVRHLTNLSNTVLGPPSNVAVSPDGTLAVLADSIELDPGQPGRWRPQRRLHLLDLTGPEPRRAGEVEAGEQPSGVAFSRDGRQVLVANRAGGGVTAFARAGLSLRRLAELRFTHPTNEVSDVAISPDGRLALAAVREAGHLQVLRFDGHQWVVEPRRISVYGRPYRVLFTPDGRLALTAGAGAGNGPDTDALTVIAVKGAALRTTDFIALGSGPESIELSPDGRHALGVMMNGSNLPPDSPHRTEQGQLVLLERTGDTFVRRQVMPVGRIPEGACFTPDGRHVVVQCHPERRLWILALHRGRLKDTGLRVDVPGFPSGLGAGGGR